MAVDQKVIEKLQKLLALSASENEHEAALAMQKAENLMKAHNLSVQDVAQDGSGADIDSVDIDGGTKHRVMWQARLADGIASAFNGRSIILSQEKSFRMTIVAAKTDAIIIVDLYDRLCPQIKRMSKQYVTEQMTMYPFLSARRLGNSYRHGIVTTIADRLKQVRKNSQPDSQKNAHGLTGMDLIVVKDQAVEKRFREMFPKTMRSQPKLNSNPAAYAQGQIDGNNLNLHRSLNNGQTPAALTNWSAS